MGGKWHQSPFPFFCPPWVFGKGQRFPAGLFLLCEHLLKQKPEVMGIDKIDQALRGEGCFNTCKSPRQGRMTLWRALHHLNPEPGNKSHFPLAVPLAPEISAYFSAANQPGG